MMDTISLATLEEAIEPYRRAGYTVISQSEGSITLTYPPVRFNYLIFLILLLVWPLAVIYLISFNRRVERRVCLRITSQGYIEANGYTLELAVRERRHERWIDAITLIILALIILTLIWILR
jgi:hypothetical protein